MSRPRPTVLLIDDLADDARGVTRVDGKVAFVDGALAGERVTAALVRTYRRHDEYRLLEVVEGAAERVQPPCPIAGRCGGCHLQHLARQAQLRHKTRMVLELLRRQAGLEPRQLDDPLPSPPFGYRRRARLALHTSRGRTPVLGFRGARQRSVVATDTCAVLTPALAGLPGRLQVAIAALRRPDRIGHLELYENECPDGSVQPLIHAHTIAALDPRDVDVLVKLAASETAWLSTRVRGARLDYLHRPSEGAPGYLLPAFGLRLAFEPGDFVQSNGAVNRLLVDRVTAWLDPLPRGHLLDAYCGLGNLGLPLARRGFEVLGLEVGPAMVERAAGNAAAHGLTNVQFLRRDVDGAAPPADADVVVLDPPRAGAAALVEAVAARGVPHVLYVSCSPPTLARDAATLAARGYRLERLALVDMFPQTRHAEAMALFRK